MSYAAEKAAREKRIGIAEGLKPLLDALNRGEALSVEQRTEADQRLTELTALDAEIRSYEQLRTLAAAGSMTVPDERGEDGDLERREKDFSAWLKRGVQSAELRAAGEATGSAGGFLVPTGFWQRLQVAMKAFGGADSDYQLVETESGQPMPWSTVDPTTTVATLITENNTVPDVDYVFGNGQLNAYMYTTGAQKISFQLANDSAFDLDGFVRARIAESFGRAQALSMMTGTGTNQPLGVIPALNTKGSVGTSGGVIAQTGGFVTLGAAAAVKNFAGSTTELISNTVNPTTLLSMIAAVDPAYRALGACWYFNDNQIIGLRGQVDANGRPLINLQDGLSEGAIGTVFGYPVKVSQNIPNLTASTTGGPVFGHMQTAMVKRVVNQSGIMRLNERYADNLQVGYIGYMRWDSRSNDTRAAVTVKPAAT